MSYEPTQWKDGDLVTSAKLNKIEQGIAAGGGILIAHRIDNGLENSLTLDKTWQEIHDVDVCYIVIRGDESSSRSIISETYVDEGRYKVTVENFGTAQTFSADSPNGTLTLLIEDGSNEPVV